MRIMYRGTAIVKRNLVIISSRGTLGNAILAGGCTSDIITALALDGIVVTVFSNREGCRIDGFTFVNYTIRDAYGKIVIRAAKLSRVRTVTQCTIIDDVAGLTNDEVLTIGKVCGRGYLLVSIISAGVSCCFAGGHIRIGNVVPRDGGSCIVGEELRLVVHGNPGHRRAITISLNLNRQIVVIVLQDAGDDDEAAALDVIHVITSVGGEGFPNRTWCHLPFIGSGGQSLTYRPTSHCSVAVLYRNGLEVHMIAVGLDDDVADTLEAHLTLIRNTHIVTLINICLSTYVVRKNLLIDAISGLIIDLVINRGVRGIGEGQFSNFSQHLFSIILVIAVEVEGVHGSHLFKSFVALHETSDFISCQGILVVLVDGNQEVAVPVLLLREFKVALEVVLLQAQEVIPARDDHVINVTERNKCGVLVVIRLTLNLIGNGVAVLVLGHLIGYLGHNNGVGRNAISISVHQIGHLRRHKFNGVTILFYKIDGVQLVHRVSCHFVQRRLPGEGHVIDVSSTLLGCCNSIQPNLIKTDSWSVFCVVLAIPTSELVDIGAKSVLVGMHARRLIGFIIWRTVVTSVNSMRPRSRRPPQESIVGDKEVHARERKWIGIGRISI